VNPFIIINYHALNVDISLVLGITGIALIAILDCAELQKFRVIKGIGGRCVK
jgi:hypothetical protein